MKLISQWWRKALLCALLLILSLFFQRQPNLPDSYIGKDVSSILAAMPKGDRKKLEYFFLELITWNGFGYVLLGKKPMAFTTSAKKPGFSQSILPYAIAPRKIKYIKSCETWKKYKKFFPMTQFLFFEGPYDRNYNCEPDIFVLINKKEFIKKVEQHLDDFKIILNHEVSGEELLKACRNKPLFSDALRKHQGLFGILLGFGRDNAYLFHQRDQFASESEWKDFDNKFQFHSVWTEKEWEDFFKKFESVSWISEYITGSHMKNLDSIALPGFGAISTSSETQHLRKHYLETKQAIIEYYKNKDFLETTLRLLTSKE